MTRFIHLFQQEASGAGPRRHEKPRKRETLPPMKARLAAAWFGITFLGQLWTWLILVLCLKNVYTAALAIVYVAHMLGPGMRQAHAEHGALRWPPWLKKWSVWKHMAAYYPARLIKTCDLDPKGNYIFAMQPHGLCGHSAWISFATDATNFSGQFPGIDVHCVTLDGNFRSPLLREYILLHGVRSAGRRSLCNILTSGPGSSVLLVPGGAAESLLSAPGTYDTIVGKRQGFVKVAMDTGASLVPVLSFGETDTYFTYIPPKGSWGSRLQAAVKKYTGIGTPVFWGIGLFGGWGIISRPVPLNTVVGPPIAVARYEGSKHDAQYQALVDKYHEQYLTVLLKLWEEHKDKYAPDRRGELHLFGSSN